MSRVALLGGSFNPPHLAHLMACLWALSAERADEVWIVPCWRHAFQKDLLAYDHRRQMCALAIAVFPADRVRLSDIEAEIGGESRTVVTLRQLIARHSEHRFSLLIGADLVAERQNWFAYDEIERLAEFLVVGREGYASPSEGITLPAISSSEIRARMARGDSAAHLLPAGVQRYIEAHHLYR